MLQAYPPLSSESALVWKGERGVQLLVEDDRVERSLKKCSETRSVQLEPGVTIRGY